MGAEGPPEFATVFRFVLPNTRKFARGDVLADLVQGPAKVTRVSVKRVFKIAPPAVLRRPYVIDLLEHHGSNTPNGCKRGKRGRFDWFVDIPLSLGGILHVVGVSNGWTIPRRLLQDVRRPIIRESTPLE